MIKKLRDDINSIRNQIEQKEIQLENYDNFKTYEEKLEAERELDKLKFEESLFLRSLKEQAEILEKSSHEKKQKSQEIKDKCREKLEVLHKKYIEDAEKELQKANTDLEAIKIDREELKIIQDILNKHIIVSEQQFILLKTHLSGQIKKSLGVYY